MESTPAPSAPAAPARTTRDPNAPPKSYIVTLTDAAGNRLQFTALGRKDGSWTSFGVHYLKQADGKLKRNQRGATDTHEGYEAARKAVDQAAKVATGSGWSRTLGGGGGFATQKDAFDLKNLPAPAAPAKAPRK
jgi:hypothetical protein